MNTKLTELEAGELQKQGLDLYKQKKYQAALQRFNAVLRQDRKPLLSSLDNRATTHAKLGDLQAALRDGRRMIQEYKASCSGYLRTGQILQLLDKETVALDIYTYGLRNVSTSDPSKELIQGMYNKLVHLRRTAIAVDPLVALPVEIVEIIFQYLQFRKTVACLRVSQSWRSYLCSLPNLWSNLDLSNGNKNKDIRLSTVMAYIKHSRGRVRHASLHGLLVQSPVLKCIATRCKALAHLEVHWGLNGSLQEAAPALGNLRSLNVATDMSLDSVCQILSKCQSLVKAQFHSVTARFSGDWIGNLTNLRELSIHAKRVHADQSRNLLDLPSMIPMIKSLQSLSLRNWHIAYTTWIFDLSPIQQLEHLDLANVQAGQFPKLPPGLQSFDISNWHECLFASDISQDHIEGANLLTLTSFSVGSSSGFLFTDLCKILEPSKGKLTSLNVGNITSLEHNDLAKLITFDYVDNVVELRIPGLPMDDKLAELLAGHSSALRILDVGHTKITGVGVKSLVLGCKLETLGLKGCQSVNVDAVEWARSKGIAVAFTFTENDMGKSKRIR